jgi:uncharacterized protein YbbC (DUF1343 family)
MKPILILLIALFSFSSLWAQPSRNPAKIEVGASRLGAYVPLLKHKKVALVINQTSMVHDVALLDTLLSLDIQIAKIFTPEHGFRGSADAGAHIDNAVDTKTGIPIISLYGAHKQPTAKDFENIDIVLFDLQDVGVRFYTYISTLEYVMQACVLNNKEFIVLDRPNPNGFYIDGPVLDTSFKSFVGMQPIPIVYGMTIAEYALMLKGTVAALRNCKVKVISCLNYTHAMRYTLPVAPSPNLKNNTAIYLYPSLCLFEGTIVSVGRGTAYPFQQFGHPSFKAMYRYSFVPQKMQGATKPLYESDTCYGALLATTEDAALTLIKNKLNLTWLMETYKASSDKEHFFNPFFQKLVGNQLLEKQLIAHVSEDSIRASWSSAIQAFKKIRKKYLLYTDFE